MRDVKQAVDRQGSSRIVVTLRSPGLWLMFAGLELMFLVHVSEFLYPGYDVSTNYISDLGIGPMPSSAIFNAAVVLFGTMALLAAVLMRQDDKKSKLWLLLSFSGIGAIGVGVFTLDYETLHRVSAFTAFFFGNLAVLYSCKLVRPPVSYVFAVLGLIGLLALALFGARIDFGLGDGGMERMILYPAMFWAIGFGAYLSAEKH